MFEFSIHCSWQFAFADLRAEVGIQVLAIGPVRITRYYQDPRCV